MRDEKKKPVLPTFWLYAFTLIANVVAFGLALMAYQSHHLEFSPVIALGVAVVLLVLAFELSRNWEHYRDIRASQFRSRESEIKRMERELAEQEEEFRQRVSQAGRTEQGERDNRRDVVAKILFWWREWGQSLVSDSVWDDQAVADFLQKEDPEKPGRPRYAEYLEPTRVATVRRDAANAAAALGTAARRQRLAAFAKREARDLVEEHLGSRVEESELQEIFRLYHNHELHFVKMATTLTTKDGIVRLSADKQLILEGFQKRMHSLIQESTDDEVLKARLRSVGNDAMATALAQGQRDLADQIQKETDDALSRVERGEYLLP